jgi:hypothetical protein
MVAVAHVCFRLFDPTFASWHRWMKVFRPLAYMTFSIFSFNEMSLVFFNYPIDQPTMHAVLWTEI